MEILSLFWEDASNFHGNFHGVWENVMEISTWYWGKFQAFHGNSPKMYSTLPAGVRGGGGSLAGEAGEDVFIAATSHRGW